MSSDDNDLISREEVLVGLPAKRANTLLFLIENRTMQVAMSQQVEFSLTEQAAHERDLAFLEAFALGSNPPLRPTIQQLERYTLYWKDLVPDNPRLKAAIVQALSQKYNFTYLAIPNIRNALGLDSDAAVQEAYSRLYKKSLETVFASKLTLSEKLRWISAALAQSLESLPPFWLASLITVALGLPQAFLAVPIACAAIGPLATVVFLLFIGAINIVTMACMAEAIGRSGDFRYGSPFIKQLVANYLGSTGSFILSIAVGIRVFLIALACYIGLSVAMANFTQIPAGLWAMLLFSGGLYLLSRKSLNFTIAVMVLLAGVNVSLLLILSLLALQHVQPEYLLYVNLPFFSHHVFSPKMLQQLLGVSLMLYFGHVYVGECAKLILPRDKSASSLIWGSIAGTAFLTVMFCIWVLAVNGAISPELLTGYSGTVLEPLTVVVGPVVTILGTVLVTLLLGMAWLRSSSLLLNLAKEWFPPDIRPVLILPRQQGRVILHPNGNPNSVPYIGISYLGLEKTKPKFHLDIQLDGKIHHIEITFADIWEIQEILAYYPELRNLNSYLRLDIKSANQENVCLQLTSHMLMSYSYGVKFETKNQPSQQEKQKLSTILLSKQNYILSISPLILVFLITEWLFLTGVESFTNILAFAGVLGNSLVGGVFPILLLISSRRKGELVPGVVLKILNHPVVSIGIYSLFLTILFIHGLFIWKNPVARISALCIAILLLGATLVMLHYGAFASRMVVELREEQAGKSSVFAIAVGGKPKVAEVLLGYDQREEYTQASRVEITSLESLRYIAFNLPIKKEKELRVWMHTSDPSHEQKLSHKTISSISSRLGLVEIDNGNKKMQFDLKLCKGRVLLPISSDSCSLKFTFR
jgi:hypothetical protein